MPIEFAPDGAMVTKPTANMQTLQPDIREKLNVVQSEIALLSGRIKADTAKIKSLQAKIDETPLGQQLNKKRLALSEMKKRLAELETTHGAIIQIATGNMNNNMTMSEVFDSLFGEIEPSLPTKKLGGKKHE